METVNNALEYVRTMLNEQLSKNLTYHNFDHTYHVYTAAKKLAEEAGISEDEKEILLLAALFHDTGFTIQSTDHEKYSQQIATQYLSESGFSKDKIDYINKCIAATKLGAEYSDPIAQLLQDADMSGLGSDDFQEYTERLRKEENSRSIQSISKKEWLEKNIHFLKSCTYKTEAAKTIYNPKKKENLAELIKKQNKRSNKEKKSSINRSKNAQTQFKTALRNHIDLSSIADNKANIMISVNALILTVALPFLIDRSMEDHRFWIATIILALVCLTSMIFATLATRPIQMSGITNSDNVENHKSNLFFFGNFYKMPIDEYSTLMKEVLNDEEKLDDSIIADLYYLGRSLGKKFSYLRWCYNMFMYGVSFAVLSLFIVFLIS